jgi:hypothetical protein
VSTVQCFGDKASLRTDFDVFCDALGAAALSPDVRCVV